MEDKTKEGRRGKLKRWEGREQRGKGEEGEPKENEGNQQGNKHNFRRMKVTYHHRSSEAGKKRDYKAERRGR